MSKQQMAIGQTVSGLAGLVRGVVGGTASTLFSLANRVVDLVDRYTPAVRLITQRTRPAQALERLERQARTIAPDDLLATGDRRAWIEQVAPPATHPLLYRAAPPELAYSLVSDGRALDGKAPARALGPTAITDDVVLRAYSNAVRKSLTVAVVVLALGAYFVVPAALPHQPSFRAGAESTELAAPIAQGLDVWGDIERAALTKNVATRNRVGHYVGWLAGGGLAVVNLVLLIAGLLAVAYTAARLAWIGSYRGAIFAVAEARAATVRIDDRDALQRWRWRREQKLLANAARADAIQTIATFDRSPTLELGVATGTMAVRGHLDAPMAGAPIRLSVNDAAQNILVIGATGEGKSRNFVTPLIQQLLDMRARGLPIAIYLTDDKGVLWADLAKEAAQRRLPVRVIGTAPGQLRVDLLAGVAPTVFADVMRAVAMQVSGARGDDFWPDQASSLVADTATILQAFEYTAAGAERVRTSGMRQYSINRILYYACAPEACRDLIVELATALKSPVEYPTLAQFDKPSLHAAIESYQGFWATLADATLTGIQANVRKALRQFVFSDELSLGFADGAGEDLLPIDALHANEITAINVSQIEHGLAGKLVNIMLKTSLMRAARAAEARDPASSSRRLQWWSKPGATPATDSVAWTFFIADEYQSLATAGGTGIDDSTFWNLNRSSGVVGVILSQSVSAFKLALGPDATQNMLGNFRTKIFMRTEDVDTIDFVRRLAGKALRFESMAWSSFDSQAGAALDGRADPDRLPPVDVDAAFKRSSLRLGSNLQLRAYDDVFDRDAAGNDDEEADRRAKQWRHEDRNQAVRSAGRHDVDTVREEDMMAMGRGRAVAFVQRAGVTIVDVVQLDRRAP